MSSRADVLPDVRQLRERFITEGSLDEPILRRSVLESWRRSQLLHVHPDRPEVPFVSEPNTESRLAHAAGPVLQRIIDDLAAQAITVVLTSADGVVLERTASEAALMQELDAVLLAPGYSFAEEFAGTNGIGTALETGRPAFISGGEHYVGPFGRLACAGAPIRDPVTGRMIGIVDLTCWARESDPLLSALAKSAGGQIEDRMRASAHESEIALLEAYLHHERRVSLGVLAIGGDVVLMNRYLRQTLDANDQVALLAHASDMVSSPVAGTFLSCCPAETPRRSPRLIGPRCAAAGPTSSSISALPPKLAGNCSGPANRR
jgi:sigma-54 dependent transcriptional regulator, acetoin dehydrogenase operon transcriptional activator AcoR